MLIENDQNATCHYVAHFTSWRPQNVVAPRKDVHKMWSRHVLKANHRFGTFGNK
jgi:hypothetical protein